METRILGKTNFAASILGFGCMRLPLLDSEDPSSIDFPAATRMIRRAIDRGLNYLDTAYPYHRKGGPAEHGRSEYLVAHALRDGYRDKVRVATKLPTWIPENRADMHRLLDEQLAALETPRIDFYLAHNLNSNVWPKMREIGMLDFLNEARRDGRVAHVGFSFHDGYPLFREIMDAHDWEFTQVQYNYLDVDHQAGRKGIQLAVERGVGVIVMEPLRGGYLVNSMPEEAKRCLAEARPDWSLAEWALRWCWSQPGVDLVLGGMSTMEQTEENLSVAASFQPLSRDEEAAVERVREIFATRVRVGCTACGYCLPCPAGVHIPNVFSMYNDYFLMDEDSHRERARLMYSLTVRPDQSAENCTGCAACEAKCPQGIPVSAEMGRVRPLFHGEAAR